MMARRLPPEPLHAQPREVDLQPPARRRVLAQQRRERRDVERRECLGNTRGRATGQGLDRLLRRELLEVVMQQRQQREHRNRTAVGGPRHVARGRREQHHMQHHAIVGAIAGVCVRRPIRRMQVQLDLARDRRRIVELQPCTRKIRPAEQIPFARMEHAHAAPVGRGRHAREVAAQPDFLEQFLGKRKRPIEPLDFGDRWIGLCVASHAAQLGGRKKARQAQAFAEVFPDNARRGGRVVYCGGLENRCGRKLTGGSNPSLSATFG